MTPSQLHSIQRRYIALFGDEPARPGILREIEQPLGVTLPDDFNSVSTFYSGGILGGISHHAIATCGPGTTTLDETARLREAVNLPHSLIVLAEPAESLIVLDTIARGGSPSVLWMDASDAPMLANPAQLREPQVWGTYSEFVDFLLTSEEEERGRKD